MVSLVGGRLLARVLLAGVLLGGPGEGIAQTPEPPVEPPPNGADYWTVPGFKEHPPLGPEKARGIIFWSHGLSGRRAQYQYPPPGVIEHLAKDGWDIVKINRNPIYETSWLDAGLKHVRDLSARADKAKAEGYRQVLAAGQSYGGAISIEASARNPRIDAVLALSPGQGSDAGNISNSREFENLTRYLIESIEGVQAAKVAVMLPAGDSLHPFEVRGPKVRSALANKASFVLFEESMPIKGHGAGYTEQFAAWYGGCLTSYFAAPTVSGETVCPSPAKVPTFLTLDDQKIVPPPPGTPPPLAALSGSWFGDFYDKGKLVTDRQEVGLVIETVSPEKLDIIHTYGAGPKRMLSMQSTRYAADWDGERFFYKSPTDKLTLAIWPAKGETFRMVMTGFRSGTVYEFEMRRLAEP